MSTLQGFLNHELAHRPNDIKGRANPSEALWTQHPPALDNHQPCVHRDGSAVLSNTAKRQMAAMQCATRPALFYTQQQAKAVSDGVIESDETVRHRMYSKEEFPQG